MIVISDNSALSALAETGMLDLLPRLFGKVVIPESVHREGLDPGSPVELREWILAAPAWVEFISGSHGSGAVKERGLLVESAFI